MSGRGHSVRGRAPVAACAIALAVASLGCGLCTRPGTARGAPVVQDCVRARACLWRGRRLCSRMSLGCHCARPGSGCRPAPAQSLLRGDVFQTGFLRSRALQPKRRGNAAPTGLQRPERPGDCRLTPEGGRGAHPGGVQSPVRRVRARWGD